MVAAKAALRVAAAQESAEARAHDFYRRALLALNEAQVPYLVGGAYALEMSTGITRHTKDLDLFVKQQDCRAVLAVLEGIGCRTEVTHPHWLAKAFWDDAFMDIIYNSGNGQAAVDESWFERAEAGDLFGVPVKVCSIEETIWSKSFIMERERFDGADIAHVLRTSAEHVDWHHLLKRFGDDWPLLLSHLILFGYLYPGERKRLPAWVVRQLGERAAQQWEETPAEPRLCRGPLISRAQYTADIEDLGYLDARVRPYGQMTPEQARQWSSLAEDPPRVKRDT